MGSVVGDDQSSSKSDDSMASNKVKFLCSHGGKILPRPIDGHLRYVGGETRVVAVDRGIGLADLMKKLGKMFGTNGLLKYQLPTEDMDTLVTVRCSEDLENMMEEHDRYEGCKDGILRLRAFLFPLKPALIVLDSVADQAMSLEQRYVDAVNGVRTISRLRVESPSGASPSGGGSPFKVQPDSLFGLESANGGLTEIECLSPTAPSDPGVLTPSPTHADSNSRRRNGATKPAAILYVKNDGARNDMSRLPNDDASYQSNSMRKVSSEGLMGAANGSPTAPGPTVEPQEMSTTRFHREKDNMMHFDGNHHGVTSDMHRVHSTPNLLQYQYVHTLSPTYRAKRIIMGAGGGGGGGLATSKVGPPLYNNTNNNISRPPGSLLRYTAQRVVNPPPQILYVARPRGNPEQVIKAVHFPDSDGSISSGEEAVNNGGGGHHQYLRVINNNNHNHNINDNVEYQ